MMNNVMSITIIFDFGIFYFYCPKFYHITSEGRGAYSYYAFIIYLVYGILNLKCFVLLKNFCDFYFIDNKKSRLKLLSKVTKVGAEITLFLPYLLNSIF